MNKSLHARTWIEVSKSAIKHNYTQFRKLLQPSTKLLGVVKSNAYGHELMAFAKELEHLGADWLGVDSIVEANTLRKEGVKKPILVLGYTLPENFTLAQDKNIAITISTFENLRLAAKHKLKSPIHIKVDTGMHRQGFFVNDLKKVFEFAQKSHLNIQGIYTHFAAAKKPDTSHETEHQIILFKKAISIARQYYPKIISHAGATAGTLNYPEAHFDMVRVGIGLYGLWPSEETKKALSGNDVGAGIGRPAAVGNGLDRSKQADGSSPIPTEHKKPMAAPTGNKIILYPVLTWKTLVGELKIVDKNEKIGYDFTETLKRTSKIAILPIGYWHGYFRALSGKSHVLIRGTRCKVLGRVSMDMLIVDVTDANKVKVGDEAVLLGKQGIEEITADELGTIAGTTSYEIITRLNPLIKKIYK